MHKVDRFKIDTSFKENGQAQFTTTLGTILSIVILLIVIIYAEDKAEKGLARSETMYQDYEEFIIEKQKSETYGYE